MIAPYRLSDDGVEVLAPRFSWLVTDELEEGSDLDTFRKIFADS